MSDLLTQLQDAVDMMATQFFSALRYVGTHHDSFPPNGAAPAIEEDKKDNALADNPEVFEGQCVVRRARAHVCWLF